MQCEDLDLSKSQETSYFSEDLSQIKFSINSIILEKSCLSFKRKDTTQGRQRNIEPQNLVLKLKFYSVLSGCKIKQKIAKVSILRKSTASSDSYILDLQEDTINLKVSFPINQQYEIMGKVYAYQDEKSQEINGQKILVGYFQINLLQWTKDVRKRSISSEQNPEILSQVKKIELKVPIIEKPRDVNEKLSKAQNFSLELKNSITSSKTENIKGSILNHQNFGELKNFIQIRIIHGETFEKFMSHFNMKSIEQISPEQRKAGISNLIADQKAKKTKKPQHSTTRNNQFYLLPEKKFLKHLHRPKSEALLQSINKSKVQQSRTKTSAQDLIKRSPKTFNEKIYELLQEVKHFKYHTQLQRQSLQLKTSISRIKKIYSMNPIRLKQPRQSNAQSQKLPQTRVVTQFENIGPLSSIIKNSISQMSLSMLQNQLESTLSLNAKHKQVSRVQERLGSFQKMKNLSCMNLFKIQQSQQASEKINQTIPLTTYLLM